MASEVTGTPAPSVTIGFFARERFSWAPRALQAILDSTTDIDYRVVIVDSLTPPRYLAQLEALAAGRENIEFLRIDRHLLPNEARNLIAEGCTTEYLALIENDVVVTPGWLTALLAACRRFDAGVAVPLIREKDGKYHADSQLGNFSFKPEGDDKQRLGFAPIEEDSGFAPAQTVECAECHCMLFRTDVIKQVKPFDDFISARDFIDISLTLRAAGVRMVFEPTADVTVNIPPPVQKDEMPFYAVRWDWDRAVASHARIREKWNLSYLPSSLAFVRERRWRSMGWRWPIIYAVRLWPRRRAVGLLPKPIRRSLRFTRDRLLPHLPAT